MSSLLELWKVTPMTSTRRYSFLMNLRDTLVDETDELRNYIVACEILAKSYPNGRGGGDNYVGPYWSLVQEGWYHNGMGYSDSYDGYSLIYYDENSEQFDCEVVLDDEMKKEIAGNTAEADK